jgi:hypothetical protein
VRFTDEKQPLEECWDHPNLCPINLVAALLILHAKAYVFSSIKSLCLALWVQWVLLKSLILDLLLLQSKADELLQPNFLATPTAPKWLNIEI